MLRKKLDKDLEIVLVSNFEGGFYYLSKNQDAEIDFEQRGDIAYITFRDLQAMYTKYRKFFKGFQILIAGAAYEDDITTEDIYAALLATDALKELQEKLKYLNTKFEMTTDWIDNAILKLSTEQLEKALKSNYLRTMVIGRIVGLKRSGKMHDTNKMGLVEKYLNAEEPDPDFWRDIDVSLAVESK
jgi:hypothetical protein